MAPMPSATRQSQAPWMRWRGRTASLSVGSPQPRPGPASFEGLCVKNLENVQGDKRDNIIIPYGPDPKGKFYRRFGTLDRVGRGRRLNVLITRARQEVHLVTSIPESYR